MKLLIVTQAVDPSHPLLGFFAEWLEAIVSNPCVKSLHVVCFDTSETQIQHAKITRVHGNRIMKLWRFLQVIWKDDAEISFVHMTPVWLIAGWLIWFVKGVKTTLWFTHGVATVPLRLSILLADRVFTATKQAFPVKSDKVVVIGHAITDIYQHTQRVQRPTDRFAVLAVGRVMPRKNVTETIRFFSKMRNVEALATLDWVGNAPSPEDEYQTEIKNVIHELGLSGAVRFIGSVPPHALPELYAAHDLLLHLSDTKSLDKVVPEALASGCPVLSSNPATKEGVGEHWYWSKPLDDDAVTIALRFIVDGVTTDEQKRIRQLFGLHSFVLRLVDSLSEIVSRQG